MSATNVSTGYVQMLCPGCGHSEHAGATCCVRFCTTSGPCGCVMLANLVPQATFGWFGSKQPFRCPVCIGSGRTYLAISADTSGIVCHACNGSGVVWGPP